MQFAGVVMASLDPLMEYKNESFNLFVDTTREIKYNSVYNILKSRFL